MGNFGHHHCSNSGNESAQAIDDLFRVLVQAVLFFAGNIVNHYLIHFAEDTHRGNGNEQHRAGTQMFQRLLHGNPMIGYFSPQRQRTAQVSQQRCQAPGKTIDPEIVYIFDKDKHTCCCNKFDHCVPKCDGFKLIQAHQAPVEAAQAADAHHGQMEGDIFFFSCHQEYISEPKQQRNPCYQQLHLPDAGESPVQLFPVIPHLGNRPDSVICQSKHSDQAEEFAYRPGLGIHANTSLPDNAGKIGSRDNRQQDRENPVGHVVSYVLLCTHNIRLFSGATSRFRSKPAGSGHPRLW